ncbi:MAG: glutathione S-transferase family protein [Kiloniellales bacterium]|nr:glutathione S-transferase family protein [Kiloniellales bacterium]
MKNVTLYGATYSVFTRIARLVLEEAGVGYRLIEIDIFDREALPAGYLQRHPFGKIPAFAHDGFRLFETDAIARYAIETAGAEGLVPETTAARARMTQIQRIVDNYAYPVLVWGVYVGETRGKGPLPPETVEQAHKVLAVLEELWEGPFLLGERLTLADLWLAPVLALFRCAPTGQALLSEFPELESWLQRLQARSSMQATRFPVELAPAGGASG